MRRLTATALLLLLVLPALGDDSARVTVYQGGGAWIERDLPLDEAATASSRITLRLPGALDPESLQAIARGGTALSSTLEPPYGGLGGMLAACLGQEVKILPAGSGQASLASFSGGTLVYADGGRVALIQASSGATVAVEAERVICHPLRHSRDWSLVTTLPRTARKALHLRYHVRNWSWRALHVLDLAQGGGNARLYTRAELHLPGDSSLARARIRLVAGDVPEPRSPSRSYAGVEKVAMMDSVSSAPPAAVESRSQDLLLFQLDEPLSLTGPRIELLDLRDSQEVSLNDFVVFEAPAPRYSGVEDDQRLVGRRHLRFVAPQGKALPAGLVSVGLNEEGGGWLSLGRSPLVRTAPGEEAELVLGEVRDLPLRWRRTRYDGAGQKGFRHQATVEIRIENPTNKIARVEIRQPMGGSYELVSAQPKPTTASGSALIWVLPLEAGQKRTLVFTALVDWRQR